MPGPGRVYGPALAGRRARRRGGRGVAGRRCVAAAADRARPDRRARRRVRRAGALDGPAGAPRARPRGRGRGMVLLRNEGVLPLDAGAARLARRDRPERRPRADHGRRLGQLRAALPRHAAGGAARGAPGRPASRHERGCDIDRTAPELRAAWTDRVRGRPTYAASATAGLLLFDAPDGGEIGPFTARARLMPGRDRAAHVHAAPGRPGPGAGRRRGRARRVRGPAAAPGQAMFGLVSEEIRRRWG